MYNEKRVETMAWRNHFEGWVRHLEGKVDRLTDRLDYVCARMDVLASAVDRIDTEVFLLGCHEDAGCWGWEYVDWTFGDLKPGDWFVSGGLAWRKLEKPWVVNAVTELGNSCHFQDDKVVYPFEWED